MLRIVICLTVALSQPVLPVPVSADDSIKVSDSRPTAKFVTTDAEQTSPIDFPSAGAILRAVRAGKPHSKNEHIQCKLVLHKVSDIRVYPLVGPARLATAHFECTVTTEAGRDVFYIDQSQLIPVK
ncbi:MAG: hypothetical protein JWM11_9 [Planctomycetaceae bacterium]|nr:hypothetical protein [Planctomycetaceae bacterium]